MTKGYVLGLIGSIILFSGCASTMADIPIDDQATIIGETIFADYETTFNAVIEVFFERGYVIKKANKSRGLIDSEYLSKSSYLTPLTLYLVGDRRTRAHAYIREVNENTTKVNLRLIVEDKFWGLWKRNDGWLTSEDYKKYFRLIGEKVIEGSAPQIAPSQSQYQQVPADPVRLWKLTPLEEEEEEQEQEQ